MAKEVVLFANLGSPDSASVADVRRYLREFLMDGKVLDIPYPMRYLLVNGIIVPFRAVSSAKKYRTIWTDEGSPLIVMAEKLRNLMQLRLGIPTYICMRYANPTPTAALEAIYAEHPDVEQITLFPLYPHYAMSSYETAVEHVQSAHWQLATGKTRLNIVPPYYKEEAYIQALAESILPYLSDYAFDHILFSYHGIPERHLRKTDRSGKHCTKVENCCHVASPAHATCYRHQVLVTTQAVAKTLQLETDQYSISFQSRLGRDKWLTPFTAKTLEELPGRGVKRLLVVCPAFVADCLETLEEIHEEGEEIFREAGGEFFQAVPCLNVDEAWLSAIERLLQKVPVHAVC